MADELGYCFGGMRHVSALGCLQLEINLYAEPSKQHFDPEEATFTVADRQEEIKHMVVAHPWHAGKTYPVCAGRVILHDRLGKVVEAFSFGGELTITVEQSHTACLLRSPAPILALADVHDLSVMFVSRVESLLARIHAAWKDDDAGFERRLAGIAPTTLFVAALAAVARQLDQSPVASRGERYWHHAAALHTAIQNMKRGNMWPTPTPSLDDLLAR